MLSKDPFNKLYLQPVIFIRSFTAGPRALHFVASNKKIVKRVLNK